MQPHLRLGRVLGVQIGLHYSWILIAVLIAFSLAGQFGVTHPEWGPRAIWVSAVVTALLFFVTLVAHELSHATVAKSRGLPVRSITLFALGGVANIEKEAEDAKTEFWMAIVGPITSLVIGSVLLLIGWALGWQRGVTPETPLLAVIVWLGYINIVLAVFNMIPGFPLDGGRVLRAAVWWVTGNALHAMRIASRVGRVVAAGFILWGMFQFVAGAGFGGLWLALIGWFLLEASGAGYAQMRMTEALRGVRVADVMARDCPTVPCHANLQEFVSDQVLRTGQACYVVTGEGNALGLITSRDIKQVPRAQWPYKTVCDAMRPLSQLKTVSPEAPLGEALETMGRLDVSQLAVTSDGRFQGIISRASLLSFLETRSELGETGARPLWRRSTGAP